MLGKATRFAWNAVDPRPVYKKAARTAMRAATYESFDTSSFFSSADGSGSSLWGSSGSSDGSGSSWWGGSGSSDGSGNSLWGSDSSGISLWGSSDSSGSTFLSSFGGTGTSYLNGGGSFLSSRLPTFGTPTFTPIPELSGQTLNNIIFTCSNYTTGPLPASATPDQLAQRQVTIGLCNQNAAYFCKYLNDASSSFQASDYTNLTGLYCGSPTLTSSTAATTAAWSSGIFYLLFVMGALICASLAVNQAIYMPVFLRIFIFLVVLGLCIINPFTMPILVLYYVFQIALDLFQKRRTFIVPATLLPLRLRQPDDGFFTRVLLAPFTYIDPSPADVGRRDYLSGIDLYVNRLQQGAKLSDATLKAANMEGMKKSIVEGLRATVEEITSRYQLQAAAAAAAPAVPAASPPAAASAAAPAAASAPAAAAPAANKIAAGSNSKTAT